MLSNPKNQDEIFCDEELQTLHNTKGMLKHIVPFRVRTPLSPLSLSTRVFEITELVF